MRPHARWPRSHRPHTPAWTSSPRMPSRCPSTRSARRRPQAAAASGFFGRRKRLAAVADRLAPVLRPGVTIKPKRLPELTAALVTLQGNRPCARRRRRAAFPVSCCPRAGRPSRRPAGALLDARVDRIRRGRAAGAIRLAPSRPMSSTPCGTVLRRPVRDPTRGRYVRVRGRLHAVVAVLRRPAAALRTGPGSGGWWPAGSSTAAGRALADPHLGSLRRWLDLRRPPRAPARRRLDGARAAATRPVPSTPTTRRRSFDLGLAQASIAERLRRDRARRLRPRRARARDRPVRRRLRERSVTLPGDGVPHSCWYARGLRPARHRRARSVQLQRELAPSAAA